MKTSRSDRSMPVPRQVLSHLLERLSGRHRSSISSDEHLTKLYERYREPLLRTARSMCRSEERAQDCVQGFFQKKVLEGRILERTQQMSPVECDKYIYRCFHNFALSQIRTSINHRNLARDGSKEIRELTAPPSPDLPCDASEAAFREHVALQLFERVRKALDDKYRGRHFALYQRLLPHLDTERGCPGYARIASEFGISVDQAKKFAERIRKRKLELFDQELNRWTRSRSEMKRYCAYLRAQGFLQPPHATP